MRFLILTQYFPPENGAAPTRLAATVRGLKRLGHEVEIVTAMPNYPYGKILNPYRGEFYRKEQWEGCTIHRFWLFAAQGKGIHRILNYLSFALITCFGIFKARRPDWIFVNSGPLFLSIPAYVASRIWRRPYIFNVADLWPESIAKVGAIKNQRIIRVLEKLEAWAYRKAEYVTGVTQGIVNVLVSTKGVPAEKVLFLPNGVDTELFHPQPACQEILERHGLTGKTVFIYPGTHGYAHALEKVLEAAALLEKSRPEVAFLFVGGGSEKEKLVDLSRQLKLKNVVFVDSVSPEELVRYISVAKFGLIHQRNTSLANETRPAKAFPMMSMAKPLLYAGFGEGAELIGQAGAGIIIRPEEPELLASTIENLLGRPAISEGMGERGRALAEREFSWNQLVTKWVSDLDHRSRGANGAPR